MSKFFAEYLTLFLWILRASYIALILIICTAIIRTIFEDKLVAGFKYIIWVIIFIRLVIPVFPQSKLSIFNYVDHLSEKPAAIYENVESFYTANNSDSEYSPFNSMFIDKSKKPVIIENLKEINRYLLLKYGFILWILGIIMLTAVHIIMRIVFIIKLMINKRYVKDERLKILELCKKRAGYYKKIKLLETNVVKSPCVFGVLKPKILIPYNLINGLSSEDLQNIFIHEIIHIKRRDILRINLAQSILTIHWFNPFIWYAYKIFREDTEVCCDKKVLNNLDKGEVENYGMTIIKLMSKFSCKNKGYATVGALGSKNQNKRRIKMISNYKKITIKKATFGVVIVLVFAITTLTDSKVFGIEKYRIYDNLKVEFVDDKDVIGTWNSVDFVKDIESFNAERKYCGMDLLSFSIQFNNGGKTKDNWLTWTKGLILHHGDKTASKYYIKEMGGKKYLFMEWKSGDYIYRGEIKGYYVFKKSD